MVDIPTKGLDSGMTDVPAVDHSHDEADDDDGSNQVDMNKWVMETIEPARPRMADDQVMQELRLCQCLATWEPFAAPSSELLAVLGEMVPQQDHIVRCMLRQTVVDQLQYEADHAATLPQRMMHNAAARYRLRAKCVRRNVSSKSMLIMAEGDQMAIPSVG